MFHAAADAGPLANGGQWAARLEKTMRNTWKGMVLGALSGAVVGLALDAIDRAAHGAGTAANAARHGANSAAHAAPDAAARATGRAREFATGRARERALALVHDGAGLAQRATRRAAERVAAERDNHAAMR
jgi:hypothetical protein